MRCAEVNTVIVEVNFIVGFDSGKLFLTRVLPNIPTEIHQRNFNSRSFRSDRNLKDIMKSKSDMEIRG
jgi:hypothetical protein